MDTEKKLSKYRESNIIEVVEKWFRDASMFDTDWKKQAKEWYGYYNGDQWTSDEMSELRDRGQAVTTYNHIAPAIDSIIGGERQNRPEIKMVGRTPDDEQIAQVKTELYNYISDNTNTDDELDKQILDVMVTGRGWMYIFPDVAGDEFKDIRHTHIDYRDMFIDPLSKKDDLSDARYVHQAVYTDADVIKEQFPKFKAEEDSNVTQFGSFEDSSEDEMWFEHQSRKRPRLISTWFRDEEGTISVVVWVKGQVLYFKKNPYTMNDYPVSVMTYKRNLDNKPYGLVKAMVSPQDEVNKRHSKALHYLNARQIIAEEDAFVDSNDAKKTLARPDGITLVRDGVLAEGRLQVVDNTVLANAHVQLMEHAKSEVMALVGINASYVGQGGQYESAKGAAQNTSAAQNTLVPFLNKIRIMRHRLAKVTMSLVSDFYTDERLVRILNPQGGYAFMPVNQVVMLDDGTLQKMNDLTVDDVDIIIEDAPSSLNDRAEQFNQLLGIQGQTGRPIPMEILLRYSNLKDKHQLASELEVYYGMEAQLQQAQQQVEQMQQQIQQMGGQVQQVTSQLTQANVARAVDSEVNKAKNEIEKEKNMIKDKL